MKRNLFRSKFKKTFFHEVNGEIIVGVFPSQFIFKM